MPSNRERAEQQRQFAILVAREHTERREWERRERSKWRKLVRFLTRKK